jgi:tetratricopeptide (TPR) repeat protein
MPDELALFAELCAVIGDDISRAFIDQVQSELDPHLGFSTMDPGVGIRHLVERRLLRRVGKSLYGFRHPMMRDAIESILPTALSRVLHSGVLKVRRIGEGASNACIARHAQLSGNNALAVRAYMQAATEAEQAFQYVEAEAAYSAVLGNLSSSQERERQEALTGRGRVHYCVGRHDDALADIEAAMVVAKERGDTRACVELYLEQATILDWKFCYPESAKAAQAASAAAANINDSQLLLRCDLAAARSVFREEKVEEAIEMLADVERRAEEQEDYPTRVIALALLGGALANLGRSEEAEGRLNDMIDLSRKVGDRFHLAVAYANRMLVWSERHDYERAIADAEQAVEVAQGIGAFPVIWVSQHTLGRLLLWLGKYSDAMNVAVSARSMQHRFSDEPAPEDTLLLARIKMPKGDSSKEELDYLRGKYSFEELSPSHQVQIKLIELWEEGGSANDWNTLLAQSESCLTGNDWLEFLYSFGMAAERDGRARDLKASTALALKQIEGSSIWYERFASQARYCVTPAGQRSSNDAL